MIAFFTFLSIISSLCVFLQGQSTPVVRIICTVLVTMITTYASYTLLPVLWLLPIIAGSTPWAFTWGPEIGWDAAVMRTQAFKAFWLTLFIMPFGLPYIILRPVAYWIGYTKFTTGSDTSDRVARGLSGLFLGITILITFLSGKTWN
jgi:hypothetical protein